MPTDPDRYIDVDFTKQPEYVFGDLGGNCFSAAPIYEDSVQILAWNDIDAAIDDIAANKTGADQLVTRIYDQKQEGSCFPPGTLVTMATGEVRPIELIRCLEGVITAEGNVGEVRNTMARPYIGQLIRLHLHGNNLLRCTPEHPVLTKRGYVAAELLTADDWVAIPKIRPVTVNVVQTAGYLPSRHRCFNELRTRKFNAPQGRTLTQIQISPLPDAITLDAKIGRIIGLFLAEGNADKQKVVWTFNINERETLVDELQSLLSDRLGLESKIRVTGNHSTARVEIYGTLWARLFEGLCSNGSGNKRLCAELASGPPEFLRAVFEGWMAGDGHRKARVNTGVTISRQLAVQMFQIATRFGMLPAVRRSEPKPNQYAASRQNRYDITFGDMASDNWRREQDDTHCWRRVRLLTKEDYRGPVFNLHIHGDESYIADGVGVHNCVANATGQAAEVIQAKQFGVDNVTHLSAISLYKRIGRSASSGSTVNDAMDEMLSTGILPLDTPENREKFGNAVMPNTGFSTPFPGDWQSTAAKFRVVEAYAVRSEQGLFTALVRREPVIVGRDGHSICYLTPTRSGDNRSVVYANSWGNWGHAGGSFEKGFGTDTERQISRSASWAFVMRTIRTALALTILLTLTKCSLADPAADAAAAIAIAKAKGDAPARSTRPAWHATYQAAWAASQKSGKPILLMATGPGCSNCVLLERALNADAEFSACFERVKFDAENPAHAAWMSERGVTAIPTLFVVDAKTNRVLTATVGFKPAAELRRLFRQWVQP